MQKTTHPSKTLREIREKIQEKTGFSLKLRFIQQALTRSSFAHRYGGESNENLEFIGDTVLGYHVVRQLCLHYSATYTDDDGQNYIFRAHEKDFTALKGKIVSNQQLAEIMEDWGLCQYLLVDQCDIDNKIDQQEKIKADLFEAIIGAIAVQANWNEQTMETVIKKVLPVEQYITDYEKEQFRLPQYDLDNAINTLKELSEHGWCTQPLYEFAEICNTDENLRWHCRCSVQDWGIRLLVFAKSKPEAKKCSAYLVLCRHFDLPNQYGPEANYPIWNYKDGILYPESKKLI